MNTTFKTFFTIEDEIPKPTPTINFVEIRTDLLVILDLLENNQDKTFCELFNYNIAKPNAFQFIFKFSADYLDNPKLRFKDNNIFYTKKYKNSKTPFLNLSQVDKSKIYRKLSVLLNKIYTNEDNSIVELYNFYHPKIKSKKHPNQNGLKYITGLTNKAICVMDFNEDFSKTQIECLNILLRKLGETPLNIIDED